MVKILEERVNCWEIPDDVTEHYEPQTTFCSSQTFKIHLPPVPRQIELTKNAMTLDFLVGKLMGGKTEFLTWLGRFSRDVEAASRLYWLSGNEAMVFLHHYQRLKEMSFDALVEESKRALHDQFDTITVFTPAQCNYRCVGCYTNAEFADTNPFTADSVIAYIRNFTELVRQAKRFGAKNVYTSGEGEPTIFPRFFDLLSEIKKQNMQWLFFTNGGLVSSEEEADRVWNDMRRYGTDDTVERLEERYQRALTTGTSMPRVMSFLEESAEYREHLHIYHSIWSLNPELNDRLRNPRIKPDYTNINIRGRNVSVPSSLILLMDHIFAGNARSRLGIEMPASEEAGHDAITIAALATDEGLKTYIEPVIETGRNLDFRLHPLPDQYINMISPLMVRKQCGWRNTFQPIFKTHFSASDEYRLFITPGMGINASDLARLGVLDTMHVDLSSESGLFEALTNPIKVFMDFNEYSGCKCNRFAQAMHSDLSVTRTTYQEVSQLVSAQKTAARKAYSLLSR